MRPKEFRTLIFRWSRRNKNKFDFSWRRTRDPYAILVSEVMLQQTQISRVLPKYEEWLKKFPTIRDCASAPFSAALRLWHGLGYNRRARFLKDAVEKIVQEYNGHVPRDPRVLETLPGVGHYTSRAVACFAYGVCEPFLDTNIRRAYIHYFSDSLERKRISDQTLLRLVQATEPKKNKRAWYYALMDYGREVLGKKKDNPNRHSKIYGKHSRFIGSRRYVRAKIVAYLLSQKKGADKKELHNFLRRDKNTHPFLTQKIFSEILASLERDKLIQQNKGLLAVCRN